MTSRNMLDNLKKIIANDNRMTHYLDCEYFLLFGHLINPTKVPQTDWAFDQCNADFKEPKTFLSHKERPFTSISLR